MFESNSKFPRIFVYIMSFLAAVIFVGMFFDVKFVGAPYFIAMIICAVIFLLDRKFATLLTNYKLTYFLFELVNLMAVISVVYYEYENLDKNLELFLILLLVVEVLMAVIDIFLLKNKDLSRTKNLIIDFIKLCSMICILTYFFGVSKLYFAIFALIFEGMNVALKVSTYFESLNKKDKIIEIKKEEKLEDIIHSNNEGDGE